MNYRPSSFGADHTIMNTLLKCPKMVMTKTRKQLTLLVHDFGSRTIFVCHTSLPVIGYTMVDCSFETNPNRSYNLAPIKEPDTNAGRPSSSARSHPHFINADPAPDRCARGVTAIGASTVRNDRSVRPHLNDNSNFKMAYRNVAGRPEAGYRRCYSILCGFSVPPYLFLQAAQTSSAFRLPPQRLELGLGLVPPSWGTATLPIRSLLHLPFLWL
jgi:hypothetical protein